jgi:orotate phosphoribosyltransferase-like protein
MLVKTIFKKSSTKAAMAVTATVKSRDPKPKQKTVATKKRVAAAIERIPLKATVHCRRLAGATVPGNVALDLCYVS